MTRSQQLIILPSLRGKLLDSGKVRVTAKFVEGLYEYQRHWPGPITTILHPDEADHSGNLDDITVDPTQGALSFRVQRFDSAELLDTLKGAALVQGGADYLLNHVPEFCRSQRIPYVYVSEYSLRTRRQIIASETTNPLLRARRYLWAWNQERMNRRNVALSAGLQCNGTPTFDAYKQLNERAFLFFDTRVGSDLFSGETSVASRIDSLRRGAPIKLAFSGRLHPMKGADHLPIVASHLRDAGVPFTLDICGDGPLFDKLRADIEQRGLGSHVRLRGSLDFKSELVPFMKSDVDLFVCCHRQGDPSCTYLETLSCGVPIAGYDNEAFEGVLRESAAGWKSPMNRPKELADKIAAIYKQPDMLVEAAQRAVAFSRDHLEDVVFARRVAHMREIASL